MKILIVGAGGMLGKAFIKASKKKHNFVTLDLTKDDVKEYAPIAALFAEHKFDAVLNLTAEGNFGAQTTAEDLNLFKNLQYAAILNGVKNMVTAVDAGTEPGLFDPLLLELIQKDKIGSALRIFGLYGTGGNPKSNPLAKIMADAKKKGVVTLECNREVSAIYVADAVNVIAAFLDKGLPQGVYDVVPPTTTTLVDIVKSARKALKTVELTVKKPQEVASEYIGNGEKLVAVFEKLKFTALNTGIAKTLE